jgi:hypothetical protein
LQISTGLLANSSSGFPKRNFDLGAHRGIAVVVASNYVGAIKLKVLKDAVNDAKEMQTTLQEHKLQVVPLLNREANKSMVLDVLQQLSDHLSQYKGQGLKENKVLVFVFSGHGKRGEILMTHDEQELFLEGEVIKSFHYQHLKEIPKLFFIDACRGNHQILRTKKSAGDYPSTPDYIVGNNLIARATIPDHCAYDGYGHWMRKLAKKIKERDESLSTILDDLTGEVRSNAKDEEALQPEYVSRLWGSFRFHLN